jgi:NADPH oxidase
MIPAFLLFGIDRIVTIIRSMSTYEVLPQTRRHLGDVLELRMEKPKWFKYEAGHYIWVNVPTISKWQWHPFTLTSAPHEDHLSVHINLTGDWTKAVGSYLAPPPQKGKKISETHINIDQKFSIPVRIDGPYGTASGEVFEHTHVILVGGGIGVTPFVSVLKSISHAVRHTKDCPLQGVHFIWVAKNQDNFKWFIPVLAKILDMEDLRGFMRVSIYLTGTRHAIQDIRLFGMSMLIKRAKAIGEDLVTGLEASTTFGRPNFQRILLQANQEWSGNNVGVFFCGPGPLATSIKLTCDAFNKTRKANSRAGLGKQGAKFIFKQEFF